MGQKDTKGEKKETMRMRKTPHQQAQGGPKTPHQTDAFTTY